MLGLGEGQSFSNEAGETLAEGVVKAFNMSSQPRVFAYRLVLFIGDDGLVSFPEITEGGGLLVSFRDIVPELFASSNATSTDNAGNDLARVLADS